jgi:hypothetical protein
MKNLFLHVLKVEYFGFNGFTKKLQKNSNKSISDLLKNP